MYSACSRTFKGLIISMTTKAISAENTRTTQPSLMLYENSSGMKITSAVASNAVKKRLPVRKLRIELTCCMWRTVMPAVLVSK